MYMFRQINKITRIKFVYSVFNEKLHVNKALINIRRSKILSASYIWLIGKYLHYNDNTSLIGNNPMQKQKLQDILIYVSLLTNLHQYWYLAPKADTNVVTRIQSDDSAQNFIRFCFFASRAAVQNPTTEEM